MPRRKEAKKKTVQQSLEQSGQFPLLKKPADCVGKNVGVPGEHWGESCPAADRGKTFQCTITDYTLVHTHSPTEKWPAMKLVEMGIDGHGGHSESFWMRYPYPFLKFWYASYPLQQPQTTEVAQPTNDGDVEQEQEKEAEESLSAVYKFLAPLRSEKRRGRQVNVFTCTVLKRMPSVNGEVRVNCGAQCTLFGKTTGPFFKHVRRAASAGCTGHIAVLEELNESSFRQVRSKKGSWVTVLNFEESFPHHMRFVWMVASGLPSRYSRKPTMREYVRGFEPRAVLPHHRTIHRIAEAIDEVQRAQQRVNRRAFIRLHKGKACMGAQLDLWTDKHSGIVYAAVHATRIVEDKERIYCLDELLDFYMFPYVSHVSTNIRDWFIELMVAEDMPAAVWVGISPDGAADGLKAMRMIPGFEKKVDVCHLHQLQRSVLYSVGLAGTAATRRNLDARDLVRTNGNITRLQNQSREVNNNVRETQIKANIPDHQTLAAVRTNHTRWSNVHAQATRNNVMRPILTPVLGNYRRAAPTDVSVLDVYTSDDDSDDEQPRGQFSAAARQIERRKVGFTEDGWEANLQLEAFLRRPSEIKDVVEMNPALTGAQSLQLHHQLRKKCRRDATLDILLFPVSMAVKDRQRQSATIRADCLHGLVVEGRKVMVDQLTQRFFSVPPSEGRLVQAWMSKQMSAAKLLPEDWLETTEAFYYKWLRETAVMLGTAQRRSPPRKAQKKKRRTSGGGFFDEDTDSDENSAAVTAEEEGGAPANDVVLKEAACWKKIPPEAIDTFKDKDGLVDEFKLLFSLREQFPIHFALFKRLAAHLCHEANAESTFSLSGGLSNSNTHTDPSFLSTCVRINKNKAVCNPASKVVFEAYRSKFGKVPDENMVEDVEGAEGQEVSDDESEGEGGEGGEDGEEELV